MLYALIGCLIIIGFLGIALLRKQHLDKTELYNYQREVEQKKQEMIKLTADMNQACDALRSTERERRYEEEKLQQYKKDAQEALNTYHDITENKLKEIDASIEEQRQKRQASLDEEYKVRKDNLDSTMREYTRQSQERVNEAYFQANEEIEKLEQEKLKVVKATNDQVTRFENILEVLRKYDLEQQEKLFYTIHLPEEYHEDIEFLLTTVAAKVQHPDIISKLVWQEYVKPNLDETFKRIEIKNEPGIYKLTSLINGKCYIGKSTDVKRRLTDHFKSVVGITTIADQAVHHAIRKEGFWNWTIEIISYCDRDQLSELEKYYIEFFKCQEFGYNKTGGG